MLNIKPAWLIAGGLGLAGGAFMLFHKSGDAKKPAAGATDPKLGPAGADPTAIGGLAQGQAQLPGTGLGQAQGQTQGQAQGQQVGPYTVIPDPQSGVQVVFETATQQPVGYLDQQGNLVALPNAGGQAQGAATGVSTGAATGGSLSPIGAASTTDAATGAQYETLAQQLFANAGNGSVGAASSDAQSGAMSLAGAGTTMPLGGQQQLQAPATTSATNAQGQSRQVGPYTIVADGSGMELVFETATKQPVGILDQQGNLIPVQVDAAGNVSIASQQPTTAATVAGATAPATATGLATPSLVGTPAFG